MTENAKAPPLRYLLFGNVAYALPILRPLQSAIRARGGDARWFLHGNDLTRLLRDDERVLTEVSEVKRFAPHAVLAATNWVPGFFPGIKVQVFHGFNVEKRAGGRGHFRLRGMFDLYCTQGPDTTQPFLDLQRQQGYFRVTETGWPKLDPLFVGVDAKVDAIRDAAAGRPLIGFGSTFTEALSCAPLLAEHIAALIRRGDWYWALTLHPRCAPELFERFRAMAGANACFVEPADMLSLIRAADVLVADTSSIVSEFAVQRRPVVTFRNRAPKPHMLDIQAADALPAAIERALHADAAWQQRINAYADAIHPCRDGQSGARVLAAVDDFLANGHKGLKRKPRNLWRGLQMRWRLGYFLP